MLFYLSVCGLRSTTNWNARFAGPKVDLGVLVDKCRRTAMPFKAKFAAAESTLPGGCFRNCVHVRVDGREVKVFRTCCQINHCLEPPLDVLAKLAVFVFGGVDDDDDDDERTLVKCVLYPVLEVATMRLGFPVSEWKVCNLVNRYLPPFSATFWPRAKGRGGAFVLSGENVRGRALIVACSSRGRSSVLSARAIARKPSSCFVYRTGTVVTSNYNPEAHQRLYAFLARHAALIASGRRVGRTGSCAKGERGLGPPRETESHSHDAVVVLQRRGDHAVHESRATGQAHL